jgi:adenylate cyclase
VLHWAAVTTSEPSPDFWDRLASRTRPVAALATIENPRTVALLVAGAIGGATLWAVLFSAVLFASDEAPAGWIMVGLAVAYAATWIWHAATGRVAAVAGFALAASVANQIGIHLALGGYANSGGYLMWGITMTFALAMMMGSRSAVAMGFAYAVVAVVLAIVEPDLAASRTPPPSALSATLFAVVLIGNLAMVTTVLIYFLKRLAFERERAEQLLLNVLPAEVAAELKEHGETRAVRFESISVLFADIVGFTERSARMDPADLVAELNSIFTYFDGLVAEYGCEKIRTIGDGYMVACGVPSPRPDHAHALAGMALDMMDFQEQQE